MANHIKVSRTVTLTYDVYYKEDTPEEYINTPEGDDKAQVVAEELAHASVNPVLVSCESSVKTLTTEEMTSEVAASFGITVEEYEERLAAQKEMNDFFAGLESALD